MIFSIPVKKSESRSDPATLVNDLLCFSSWTPGKPGFSSFDTDWRKPEGFSAESLFVQPLEIIGKLARVLKVEPSELIRRPRKSSKRR